MQRLGKAKNIGFFARQKGSDAKALEVLSQKLKRNGDLSGHPNYLFRVLVSKAAGGRPAALSEAKGKLIETVSGFKPDDGKD